MTRLELSTPITSLNQLKGRHWSKRHAAKRQWAEDLLQAGARCIPPRERPRVKQRVVITRLMAPRQREYDFENLTAGNAKALVDTLTAMNYWMDDNPRYLDREYLQRKQTPYERENGIHTIVVIEPLGPLP